MKRQSEGGWFDWLRDSAPAAVTQSGASMAVAGPASGCSSLTRPLPVELREEGASHLSTAEGLARESAAFYRISELMQSESPGPGVFNELAIEVGRMTGYPIVMIEWCDFERSVMVIRGALGIPMEDLPMPFEVPMDVTPSGEAARTGHVLVEVEASARREYAAPFLRQLGVEVIICVPVKIDGKVAGMLSLAGRESRPVLPRVVQQAESVSHFLSAWLGWMMARDAAHRGEAELAAVYERAPSVMCLFDEHLQIVRANRAALEFAQMKAAGRGPMSPGRFFHCPCSKLPVRRGFMDKVCQECELCRAVALTFRTGRGTQRVRVKKLFAHGEELREATVLISTERIQVDHTTRVLLSLEDITDQERADEQIRSQAALLEVTRDAILVRDFEDRILYWNEGAHRLYGWPASEVLRRTMSEVLLGPAMEMTVEALRAVREREEWTGEMKHRRRDGAEITVQSRWTLVRERDGSPKAILVVSTDVTEKKLLEAQLLRAQRLESIGTLASGLAHDLNNVLAPIMMATHILREEAADDSMRTWVETLETCSRRGADIVRQVLMFARGVEGSKVPLQPKLLVEEMERIARETFPRAIEIKTQICRKPWWIQGDATQMQQVLMNLCVNARDAMPSGGVLTLAVGNVELDGDAARMHPRARAGRYVRISVEDTGTGIPPELIDKIFDPFFTTKPLGHGTGLGLPTVLGIAENHGGFVLVDSRVGSGTVFKVYLPAAELDRNAGVAAPGGVTPPRGNGEIVLVVDDEPGIRRITYVILTKNGYEAFLAADGQEAVELFRQHRDGIKLVITDLMMPKLDGPSTIRAIRQMDPGIRTITISGLGEESRLREAKAAGSDAFLNKPFTSEQLLTQVAELLAREA